MINPHYFSGVYNGADNEKLWDEVYAYLDSHYDLGKVKKIYLNADGGAWIRSGKKRIMGITSVLDEFHLQKYLMKMTGHMEDSTEDARKTLCHVVKSGTKEDFREVVDRLKDCAKQKEQKNELMRAPLISSRTGQRQKSV